GGCLAVYAAFAVVFHSFIEPAVKTQAVAPYEPSARTAQPSATAFAVRSEPAPRVTTKQRTSPTITTTPAAPEPTATVRSHPAPAAAPVPAESARVASPTPAASEPTSDAFAAAEPPEPPAAEAKKAPKKAHKTVRRDRPAREVWNPWKFFASGPFGRPSF